MIRPVIDVDENGCDAKGGFDAKLLCDDRAVESGIFERVPVTFRYPDGRVENTTQARLTAKGIAFFRGLRVVN